MIKRVGLLFLKDECSGFGIISLRIFCTAANSRFNEMSQRMIGFVVIRKFLEILNFNIKRVRGFHNDMVVLGFFH